MTNPSAATISIKYQLGGVRGSIPWEADGDVFEGQKLDFETVEPLVSPLQLLRYTGHHCL